MTKVLLIWEEIPENVKTYIFDADAEMMKWLPKCHRAFINADNVPNADKALEKLQTFLETIEPNDDSKPFASLGALVILSGFLM